MKSLQSRIVTSIILVIAYFAATKLYGVFGASLEASFAIDQVQDSVLTYSLAQQMVRGTVVSTILLIVLAITLVCIWGKFIIKLSRRDSKIPPSALGLFVIMLAGISSTGCMGPAKVLPLANIGPNETAFVIPIAGDSLKQAKFESIDFLRAHKVLAKQIEIPVRERSTGRWWNEYEWIPSVRVIKVDRSLVTREWTKGGGTGTTNRDEALSVASLDSINFHLGVNLTASILEEDAPTYLYWHGQKTLAEVVDTNVRGYLQGIMADEFGKLRLEDAKSKKAQIFKTANDETITKFKAVGITISYVGSAQGLMFDDPTIQNKINETQTAEMAVEVAKKKNLEQTELNKAVVSKAIADREAAQQFAQAAEAQKARISLDIDMVRAQAMLEAAKNLKDFKGQLPSVLPAGASLLFGLDKQK